MGNCPGATRRRSQVFGSAGNLWYKARPFLTTKSAHAPAHAAGCPGTPKGQPGCRMGRVEAQPYKETYTWPACPCGRCWRRVFISDIRPASGTRRWPRSSSAIVTGSTSSISRRRCLSTPRRRASSSRWSPTAARCSSSAPSAPRAKRSQRKRRAAACHSSATAGWAACSPTSRPSDSRSVAWERSTRCWAAASSRAAASARPRPCVASARSSTGAWAVSGRWTGCRMRCSWSTSAMSALPCTRRRSSASRWWRSSTPTARPTASAT